MDLNERLTKIEDEQKKLFCLLKDIFYMILNVQDHIKPPQKSEKENNEFVNRIEKKWNQHGKSYITT